MMDNNRERWTMVVFNLDTYEPQSFAATNKLLLVFYFLLITPALSTDGTNDNSAQQAGSQTLAWSHQA
ncbi:hypothetical protein K239x_25040 [Planctomycetes bacterium K23_9]|uniref:Uncharacterized protein n=1 Tax=Stieleria marina TaxID=1930275 RepID=A0A517NTU7_9BACT|nr:hypothetical protein K239x_25040 [Planctomycetes bacterium K23_9]